MRELLTQQELEGPDPGKKGGACRQHTNFLTQAFDNV